MQMRVETRLYPGLDADLVEKTAMEHGADFLEVAALLGLYFAAASEKGAPLPEPRAEG